MEKLDYSPCDFCTKSKEGRCNLMVHPDILLGWEDLAYCPIVRRMRPDEVIFNGNVDSQGYPEPTLVNQNTGEVYPQGL